MVFGESPHRLHRRRCSQNPSKYMVHMDDDGGYCMVVRATRTLSQQGLAAGLTVHARKKKERLSLLDPRRPQSAPPPETTRRNSFRSVSPTHRQGRGVRIPRHVQYSESLSSQVGVTCASKPTENGVVLFAVGCGLFLQLTVLRFLYTPYITERERQRCKPIFCVEPTPIEESCM